MDRLELFYENKPLNNKQRLNDAGVTDLGMLFMSISASSVQKPVSDKPKLGIAQMIKKFDTNNKNSITQFNIPTRSYEEFKSEA